MSAVEEPKGETPVFTLSADVQQSNGFSEDHVECPICTEPYDDEKHLPVFALRCRHSVCCICLKNMPMGTTDSYRNDTPMATCPICRVGAFEKSQEPNEFAVTLLRRISVMKATRSHREAREINLRRKMWTNAMQRLRFDEATFFKDQVRVLADHNDTLLAEMANLRDKRYEYDIMTQKSLSEAMNSLKAAEAQCHEVQEELAKSNAINLDLVAIKNELEGTLADRDAHICSLEKRLQKHVMESMLMRTTDGKRIVLAKTSCPICRVGAFPKSQEPNEFAVILLRQIKVMKVDRSHRLARGINWRVNPRSAVNLRRKIWANTLQRSRPDEATFLKNQLRILADENDTLLAEMANIREKSNEDDVIAQKSLSEAMISLKAAETQCHEVQEELGKSKAINLDLAATKEKLEGKLADRDAKISSLEKRLHVMESQNDRRAALPTLKIVTLVLTLSLIVLWRLFNAQ